MPPHRPLPKWFKSEDSALGVKALGSSAFINQEDISRSNCLYWLHFSEHQVLVKKEEKVIVEKEE